MKKLLSKLIKDTILTARILVKIGIIQSSKRFRNTIDDYFTDKKLNIDTSDEYAFCDILSKYRDAERYQTVPYNQLRKLANYLKPNGKNIA